MLEKAILPSESLSLENYVVPKKFYRFGVVIKRVEKGRKARQSHSSAVVNNFLYSGFFVFVCNWGKKKEKVGK